ncbi:IS200/IS605 family transposase [Fulvivirgaceae bacterium BMA10]|uniref:IS200/IS605 family transposase n=1 Tax=Splendidivirga corallicola TaxID=3051826 RepID=A0ABT8KQU1_9BACT|nr:IS200/IS605 family transposase [Fulvivirgaceae bacterium BMA10]
MANTYTQIHIHAIFVVKNRTSLIHKSWETDLYKYIFGIIQNNSHKAIAINGMPDHLHIFFGMRPIQSLSDLIKDIKGSSSKWINAQRFVKSKFSWQPGYAAFSYSKSHVSRVVQYIKHQKIHHQKQSFSEEYIGFLKGFEIDYDERYIFKSVLQ